MKSDQSNSSLAILAGGLLGFVVLASGVWHKKFPSGGLTQVGRTATVTFEDGSVMSLTESETDLDILKKRRMRGWNGHEYQQIFITADNEEIDVPLNPARALNDGEELSTGDRLMLVANSVDDSQNSMLGDKRRNAVLANLQIDGKDRVISTETDGKDSVVTDVIDGKDRVYTDGKDFKDVAEQPVFALTADQSPSNESLDMILLGGGGDLGNLRSPLGGFNFGTGTSTGGNVSIPPIGGTVPEPSALLLIGLAGVSGLAYKAWRGRAVAV